MYMYVCMQQGEDCPFLSADTHTHTCSRTLTVAYTKLAPGKLINNSNDTANFQAMCNSHRTGS
jgi:hypothetical protein